MKIENAQIRLSASDLANHLACGHVTTLDLAVARRQMDAPQWEDPDLEVLQQRGFEHERAYLKHLSDQGLAIAEAPADEDASTAVERTVAAMRSGADVIVQATLASGRWYGRADVLKRVAGRGKIGSTDLDWHYEVVDCKLARDTRAGTILQLCLYSDLVTQIQSEPPVLMHVIRPGTNFVPESHRVDDFTAYYRFVKKRLENTVYRGAPGPRTYPDPVPHCDICRWWKRCEQQRRGDDHLCLVAGISKLQTRELQSWKVNTLGRLAALEVEIPPRPKRGAREGYLRVHEQARVQFAGRERGVPVVEKLPLAPGLGLARLPEPSFGDIFFDMEGDAFVGEHGLEYLYGCAFHGKLGAIDYQCRWALSAAEERVGFEWLVDFVMERWARFPDLRIYHFTPYETGALKRLMGRYGTREQAIDRMLRAGLFVDLHAVVRQALRASVEQYSLKSLEEFYGFKREIALRQARSSIHILEHELELSRTARITDELRVIVEGYNRDDCVSTLVLRDWLEGLRAEWTEGGAEIARPPLGSGDPSEALEERRHETAELFEQLTSDIPAETENRSEEQKARWLLANMLDWHRREAKVKWWEYYRLRELSDDDLVNEKAALSGLEWEARVGGAGRRQVDRYRYPLQETDIHEGVSLATPETKNFGEVVEIKLSSRTIDIAKSKACANTHPRAVFKHYCPPIKPMSVALLELGRWVGEHGPDAPGSYRAARDLLLRKPPRLREARRFAPPAEGENTLAPARELALALDHGVLPIQGPPGSGKTYTGARMICELVRNGKKVGITAVSHKVIRNLINECVRAAGEEKLSMRCIEKVTELSGKEEPGVQEVTDNKKVLDALQTGTMQVAAGTQWLWARTDFHEAVDVLFVDEAGQMSLANVLAASQGAKSVVLLGDPQQLEQPQQGSHPEGTEVSALEHLLCGKKTIWGRGLFLGETWRLHPDLCEFTSDVFYEGRLRSRPELARQRLVGATPFAGAGLWFVPVTHEGNQSSSPEEVTRVAQLVESLVRPGVSWINAKGEVQPLTLRDILIVAPYNAHVADLSERLPEARVGTVDKFQGQEAAVVIYSMATSSPEDAPRGMEFLYDLSRLNVATSRARCACILVANPRLFQPDCHTPRQMQLANAFCRYLEFAEGAAGPTRTILR